MATFDDLMKRVNAERDAYYLSDRLHMEVRYGGSWVFTVGDRFWLAGAPEEIDIRCRGRRASFMLSSADPALGPDSSQALGEQLQHIIDWIADPTALPIGASRYEVL